MTDLQTTPSPEAPAELSDGAQDVLRGILRWTDGRPEHLWPDHKETLCGHAGAKVERENWDEDHGERPQNALENQLRKYGYSVPRDVEELVELAHSTLPGIRDRDRKNPLSAVSFSELEGSDTSPRG